MVGISPDQVDRQLQFDQANSLGLPLLSDPRRKVARIFGVNRPGLLPNRRATFVISQDHKVAAVVRSEMDMTRHADQALAALRSDA